MQKVVRAGNIVVLDEKSPHLRNIRDGTIIKMDAKRIVHNGRGFASTKQVKFSLGRESEWLNRLRQTCKAGSIV